MNLQRIEPSVDVDTMQRSHVTVVGGAFGLLCDLVRCGLGSATLVDFDSVEQSNVSRQDFNGSEVAQLKVDAVGAALRRINPAVHYTGLARDFCDFSRDEFDEHFGHSDLFVFSTDFFPAQARGNVEALRLGKPAIWIGMYTHGRAGEVVYYKPGVTPACYRCVASGRYAHFAAIGRQNLETDRTPSTGGTIFDMRLADGLAGQIALGLLTAGADNRYGRLIQQLGNRNLVQVKIAPDYRLNGKDIFGQYLGNHPAATAFAVTSVPMEPEDDCPDCAALRPAMRTAA